MKLYTSVDIPPVFPEISYRRDGMFLGSCFADNIGSRLKRMKFPVTINPFGVLYNPASVVQSLTRMEEGKPVVSGDLFFHNGLYGSFGFHSCFSGTDAESALQAMNNAVAEGRAALERSDYLVLTLGTATVYRYRKTGEIVCNCHKFPASDFERKMLDVPDVVTLFDELFDRDLFRNKQVILTVSPIRHQRDGLSANSLSKAVLRVAADILTRNYSIVSYFPAYEVMLDELRDYRFYDTDMLHPSEQAVEYIWERFAGAAVEEKARAVFPRLQKVYGAMAHRPFRKDSGDYRLFCRKMYEQARALSRDFPFLDLTEELDFFEERSER